MNHCICDAAKCALGRSMLMQSGDQFASVDHFNRFGQSAFDRPVMKFGKGVKQMHDTFLLAHALNEKRALLLCCDRTRS